MSNHWTEQQTKIAEQLMRIHAHDREFRRLIGKSKKCASDRLNRVRFGRNGKRMKMPTAGRVDHIPDSVLEERNKRLMARYEMDLTAITFGDPPVGYSALERRA